MSVKKIMEKIHKNTEKHIRKISTVLALLLFIAGKALPAYAASTGDGTVRIPVKQIVTDAKGKETDGIFQYKLEAAQSSNPMPSGSNGNAYTFYMEGNTTLEFGPISYHDDGIYEYTLSQVIPQDKKDYTYDKTTYEIVVTVRVIGSRVKTFCDIRNADGYKLDGELSFENKKTEDKTGTKTDSSAGNSGTKTDSSAGNSGTKTDSSTDTSGTSGTKTAGPVKTGDEAELGLYIGGLLLGMALLIIALKRRRESEKEI